jgi:hypothetical protein
LAQALLHLKLQQLQQQEGHMSPPRQTPLHLQQQKGGLLLLLLLLLLPGLLHQAPRPQA